MKYLTIGHYNNKVLKKIQYTPQELKHLYPYKTNDTFLGNPMSNIALGFVPGEYQGITQKEKQMLKHLSDYAAITGSWNTTSGAKYVFANILANPNINKLVVFSKKHDNAHLLLNALESFWRYGITKEGIIKKTKATNPRFDGLSPLELKRIKKQVDLIILRRVKDEEEIKQVLQACYQEPQKKISVRTLQKVLQADLTVIGNQMLYDDGIRVEEPYYVDKAYLYEHDIYHFSEEKQLVQQLPKILFYEGTMIGSDEKLRRIEEKLLLPPYLIPPKNMHWYFSTLSLLFTKLNREKRKKDFDEKRWKKQLSGYDEITIKKDKEKAIVLVEGFYLGTVNDEGKLLRKNPSLDALAKIPLRTLFVFKNPWIIIQSKHPPTTTKEKGKKR